MKKDNTIRYKDIDYRVYSVKKDIIRIHIELIMKDIDISECILVKIGV